MEEIKLLCPNYDYIVEYDYKKEDLITKHLINYYQDNILVDEQISLLDLALKLYIENNNFYRKVQSSFLEQGNYTDDTISLFIKLFNEFEESSIKEIKNTKWI